LPTAIHRIASWRIIDQMGYLKQSGGPLLHQMLKINHLLTLRSPNANDLEGIRLTMSAPATRTKSMPLSTDLALRSFAGLAVRVGCPTRSKKKFGENDLVDNLSRDLDRARGKRDALASDVTTLTAQIAEIEARLSEEKNGGNVITF
jgi:hypothetical protein